MLGQWDNQPSNTAYHIEDSQIFKWMVKHEIANLSVSINLKDDLDHHLDSKAWSKHWKIGSSYMLKEGRWKVWKIRGWL